MDKKAEKEITAKLIELNELLLDQLPDNPKNKIAINNINQIVAYLIATNR